jgi:hypothetical protein
MKLRIYGNSVRLRLSRREVLDLREKGKVECGIRFSPSKQLTYSLEAFVDEGATEGESTRVVYADDAIRVLLPRSLATAWTGSSQVSIEGGEQGGVKLLIEKDFQCLHGPEERDPDAFPNPLATKPSPQSDSWQRPDIVGPAGNEHESGD